MEHLSNDPKDSPNQYKNSHRLCDETGIPFWVYWKVNGNWDNNTIRIFQWRESHCRTNTNVRINKSKRAGLWVTVKDLSRKFNYLRKVVGDSPGLKITRSISSSRIGQPVLIMDVKVSKDKHSRVNLIYVSWNRIKNRVWRRRRWSIEEKEVRHWVK